MKLNLGELKHLLNNVQKHKIKQVKIANDNFELLINTLPIQLKTPSTLQGIFNKSQLTTNLKHKTSNFDILKDKSHITTKNLTITSPMVGTFYRASSPSETPFIHVLDKIQPSQTVCIIEAMKLMNEIEAEVSGKIIDILVEDGEFVDCGQALMIVEPVLPKNLE